MRILVTGASGFIGAPLCRYLTQKGFEVVAASRKSEVRMPDLGHGNWDAWLNELGPLDGIVHLAARVHQMADSRGNIEELRSVYRRENTEATESLARAAAAHGVRHFIFLSSIKVLGEGSSTPYRSGQALCPQGPYAESKAMAEQKLREIAETNPMRVDVVRIPLAYGPGVKANFLMLAQAVKKGLPLPLKSVRNKRSLLYVDNLSDLIAHLLCWEGRGIQVWHASDGEDLSTPEIISLMGKALGKKPALFPFPVRWLHWGFGFFGRRGVVYRLTESLQLDVEETRRRLNWKPPFSPEEGFKRSFKGGL